MLQSRKDLRFRCDRPGAPSRFVDIQEQTGAGLQKKSSSLLPMALTATDIQNAKPSAKTCKLFDGGGLYLEVAPNGARGDGLSIAIASNKKRLSLGVYPNVSLKEARERHDRACKLLTNNIDPGEHRKARRAAEAERTANSFEVIARDVAHQERPNWAKKNHLTASAGV